MGCACSHATRSPTVVIAYDGLLSSTPGGITLSTKVVQILLQQRFKLLPFGRAPATQKGPGVEILWEPFPMKASAISLHDLLREKMSFGWMDYFFCGPSGGADSSDFAQFTDEKIGKPTADRKPRGRRGRSRTPRPSINSSFEVDASRSRSLASSRRKKATDKRNNEGGTFSWSQPQFGAPSGHFASLAAHLLALFCEPVLESKGNGKGKTRPSASQRRDRAPSPSSIRRSISRLVEKPYQWEEQSRLQEGSIEPHGQDLYEISSPGQTNTPSQISHSMPSLFPRAFGLRKNQNKNSNNNCTTTSKEPAPFKDMSSWTRLKRRLKGSRHRNRVGNDCKANQFILEVGPEFSS